MINKLPVHIVDLPGPGTGERNRKERSGLAGNSTL